MAVATSTDFVADYYAFRRFVVEVWGSKVVVIGKPGVWSWDTLNPGTAALLDVADVRPNDAVLDLGCGTGVVGAAAGLQAARGRVCLVDCSAAAVACAEHTLAANAVANAEVGLVDDVTGLGSTSFDLVLSHLPRGRVVQEELIRGAAWALRPGGRFILVASKQAGIKGAIAYARELFGQCSVVRQRKGYHVALAIKPDGLQITRPEDGYVTRSVVLDSVRTTLISKPGVFAWDRLDAGSAALVNAMAIGTQDRVLDLGCGTGLAGLAAARRAFKGQVALVDADARAVESARRTLRANGIANSEVLLSDCGSAILDRRFDVVITNPPFHQGIGVDYEVASQFVRDAGRVLRPGGRLFLVANRFLRHTELVRETFGNLSTVHDDGRYHVLMAVSGENANAVRYSSEESPLA